MGYFFTADEHYSHRNIIKYCNRPFDNIDEMNHTMITNHNKLVTDDDVTIHVGDFTLMNTKPAQDIIRQLNGRHTFLIGSHDYWMKNKGRDIWEKTIAGQKVVACHYAMRVWPVSHHGSWLVYGHSHGNLPPEGKSWDVGVDNNNFCPVSFDQLTEIMASRPDNFNLIKKR